MSKTRLLTAVLIVLATALALLAVQTLRLGGQMAQDVARIGEENLPDWLGNGHRGYVQRGVGMLVLAAGSFAAALGLHRNQPWGRIALALVLSAASLGAFALRVSDTAAYARPSLGLFASVSALAVWSWVEIFRLRRSRDA
jgi:hypothetical protein